MLFIWIVWTKFLVLLSKMLGLQILIRYNATCRHPSPSVLIPALRTVGNIVTGDDLQTQVSCGFT
jgi:hypothetical protein